MFSQPARITFYLSLQLVLVALHNSWRQLKARTTVSELDYLGLL